jgi:para-nitrobenzyl esterase
MTGQLEAKTSAGLVRGRLVRDLLAWRGIPYAAPPVGDLRLRAPRPAAPWSGVRDATTYGLAAPQPYGRRKRHVRGSEDSLTLNVLRPALPSAEPRPVMVWVHGGAYSFGSSATSLYAGERLARRGDVVVVSLNYRLGALGYLDFSSFGDFDANLGLRDQVAALEWVRDNIEAFGGDPSRVTVFGESAGGNAVTTLLCVPRARGLLSGAIAQSPAPGSVVTQEDAALRAGQLLALIGGASRLRTASAMELVLAAERVLAVQVETHPGSRAYSPVIDGDLLPERPVEAFAAGRATPVPLIIGTNADEGTVFPRFLDILPTNPARISALLRDPAVHARITAAYPGYPAAAAATALGGDHSFWWPSVRVAQGHTAVAPTWSYRYDFRPRLLDVIGIGAAHATELPAVFGMDGIARTALTALGGRRAFVEVSDRVQAHWLSFVREGAPLPSWPTYGAQRRVLVIDEVDAVVEDPRRDVRLAWQG